jgi:hypothetical protein
MNQDFSSFYKPGTPNYFGVSTNQEIDLEKLKSAIGKYKGIDFSTGKTVDLALEEFKKATGTSPESFQSFATVPPVSGASDLSPTDLEIDKYVKLQKALQPGLLDTELKQNVLGLGAATAFGAASLPFTEYMRNQELARQMQAFETRELSPTAQAARNLSGQQQVSLAASAQAEKRRAYGDLKRAIIEPLRRRG